MGATGETGSWVPLGDGAVGDAVHRRFTGISSAFPCLKPTYHLKIGRNPKGKCAIRFFLECQKEDPDDQVGEFARFNFCHVTWLETILMIHEEMHVPIMPRWWF